MLKLKKLLCISAVILCNTFLLGRPAKLEEAPIKFLSKSTYEIKKDGTFKSETQETIYIENEQGRLQFGTIPFDYSPSVSTIKVLEAKTITNKIETTLTEDQISDKPLASDNTMFDNKNRLTLAFPKLEVKSEIHLAWVEHLHTALFPGYFFYSLVGSHNPYLKGSEIIFKSELPLFVETNRHDVFDIKQTQEKSEQITVITLKETLHTQVLEEEYGGFPNKSLPQLYISSAETYDEVLKDLRDGYQEKIKQNLPEVFEDIYQKAKEKKNFFDQVDLVMAMLADKVRYMGDLRTVKGRFIARDLKEVAETGYGDCKDYSALTVSILRKLGYTADVALVQRTYRPPFRLPKHPNLLIFNHAIVYAEIEGKAYWLDPTNPTSLSKSVRADIFNREALILKKDKLSLEFIPLNSPEENKVDKKTEYRFKNGVAVGLSSHTHYSGLNATRIRDEYFHLPKETLIHDLITARTQNYKVVGMNFVDIPEINTRLPDDYHWSVDIDFKAPAILTSLGKGFSIEPVYDSFMKVDPDTYITGIFLGSPRLVDEQITLKGMKMQGKARKCKVSSPWIEYERHIRQVRQDIVLSQVYKTLEYSIDNDVVKSEDFLKLQKNIGDCDSAFIIVFR